MSGPVASTRACAQHRRRRRAAHSTLAAAALTGLVLVVVLLLSSSLPSVSWVLPAASRRGAAAVAAAALLSNTGVLPVAAKEQEIQPGYVPAEYIAKKVGEKLTTPNGLVYEPLDLGVETKGLRDGPPRSQSNCLVKFTGHINSFDGPVFDSTLLRGARKAGKPDDAEIRLNLDPTVPNGMFEALKLMKAGGKGRFVQPPALSYGDGRVEFEGDEQGQVKEKIKAGTTLYYEVELVSIVKP